MSERAKHHLSIVPDVSSGASADHGDGPDAGEGGEVRFDVWAGAPEFAVLGIDHVQLAMPAGGEDAARRFYVDLLQLEEVPKPPALAVRGGCWFERGGGVRLHLGVENEFIPARKAHPALVVAGLGALAALLEAAHITVRWSDEIPGTRRCHVDDPFGNRIELIDGGN
ncbi:MAG: hypothetical protein JWL72_2865 [Ilumatobacteraceae bacterium]|nr:hypothetical protein [Ilumatobacteraceae bacterium]